MKLTEKTKAFLQSLYYNLTLEIASNTSHEKDAKILQRLQKGVEYEMLHSQTEKIEPDGKNINLMPIFSRPKYMLKLQATCILKDEHWWAILDGNGGTITEVPLTFGQALDYQKKSGLEIVTPAQYMALIKGHN